MRYAMVRAGMTFAYMLTRSSCTRRHARMRRSHAERNIPIRRVTGFGRSSFTASRSRDSDSDITVTPYASRIDLYDLKGVALNESKNYAGIKGRHVGLPLQSHRTQMKSVCFGNH